MAKEWVTVARAAAHSQPPKAPAPTTLIDHAIQALAQAMQKPLDEQSALVEERNVWQPNSWLIQRCWETLADAGAGEEALKVARLLEIRQPLAPLQALYRTAQQRAQNPAVIPLLRQELERWQHRLLQPTILPVESAVNVDQLLHVAATATLLEEEGLALACLERIDQAPKAWSRLVTHPEQREQLAATLAHISPNPLTTSLITGAVVAGLMRWRRRKSGGNRGRERFSSATSGCEGLPVPWEPALLTSEAMDGEAQAASRERRPGGPQRTSGDGAWAAPSLVPTGKAHRLKTCATRSPRPPQGPYRVRRLTHCPPVV